MFNLFLKTVAQLDYFVTLLMKKSAADRTQPSFMSAGILLLGAELALQFQPCKGNCSRRAKNSSHLQNPSQHG